MDSKFRTLSHCQWNQRKKRKGSVRHFSADVAGEEASAVFNAFDLDGEEGDEDKIDTLKQKFKQYCEPRKNLTFLRHQFFPRSQGRTETIDSLRYWFEKQRPKNCEFQSTLNDSLIRDRIVRGIKSDQLHMQDCFEKRTFHWQKPSIHICRASEASSRQLKEFNDDNDKSLHALERSKSTYQNSLNASSSEVYSEATANHTSQRSVEIAVEHSSNQKACPAFGKICNSCRKENRFARVCRRSKTAPIRKKQAFQVDEIEAQPSFDDLWLFSTSAKRGT